MIYRMPSLIFMVGNGPLMVFFQDMMLTPDSNKNSTAERYLIFTGLFLQLGIVRILPIRKWPFCVQWCFPSY